MIHIFIRADRRYRMYNRDAGRTWPLGDGAYTLAAIADLYQTAREYGPNDDLVIVDDGPVVDACPIGGK